MDYIIRDRSLITGKKNLEHLYTFKDFPVFLGCTDQDKSKDILADMSWSICPESGVIQLDKVLSLDILYQMPHNDGVGKMWDDYYKSLAQYIKNQGIKNVLEIGGGGGKLAEYFVELVKDGHWYIIEPNPLISSSENITVIKGFFDADFKFDKAIDAVVHSQVFEHAYNPLEFLSNISKFLKIGQKHILAFPDIEYLLKNKFTTGIHFEHTFMLTDVIAEYFLSRSDFKVIDKYYYANNNNYFYTTSKVSSDQELIVFDSKYIEYKRIFQDFIAYHDDLISKFNRKIEEFDGEIYLFGAHIFSQYLIGFGLNTEKIINIIDNSDLKNGKRLYGTTLKVLKPDVIMGKRKVAVILKASIYQEEIRKQLIDLNPDVVIWE